MKELKILFVTPNELAKEVKIPNTFKAMQDLVKGPIKLFHFPNSNVCLACNENMLLTRKIPNRFIEKLGMVYGDFIILRVTKYGEFKSLTKEQLKQYQELFGESSINRAKSRLQARKLAFMLLRR